MADLPLPNKPEELIVFDIDDGKGGRLEARVEKRADGTYYGDAGEFDFAATTADEMRRKLTSWGARHVGWDHRRD